MALVALRYFALSACAIACTSSTPEDSRDNLSTSGSQRRTARIGDQSAPPIDANAAPNYPLEGVATDPIVAAGQGTYIPPTPTTELAFYLSHAVAAAIFSPVTATPHAIAEVPGIATTVRVSYERILFGSPPEYFELSGGSLNGQTTYASEQPTLEHGNRYLGFIWPTSTRPELAYVLPMLDQDHVNVIGESVAVSDVLNAKSAQ